MEPTYFRELAEYFVNHADKDFEEHIVKQVKLTMLDYLGNGIFAAKNSCCSKLLELVRDIDSQNKCCSVWGESQPMSAPCAAFINSSRTSNLELDDCSNIGASAHPGVYVYSAAFAAWEENPCDIKRFICAIVFGYDVCLRMGLLATERVRELGLHGPGIVGGLASVATAGMIYGLSVDELCNAFSITASLLPMCPFISFIEGSDSKDFYGGWGAYLAMIAIKAAKKGMAGPEHVMDAPKSLKSIFAGTSAKDVLPGEILYIDKISFKEFAACQSVHPAMTVITDLQKTQKIEPEKIEKIDVHTYPYSYDLNKGVGEKVNASSGRLSLPYTVAFAIYEGNLLPNAFFEASLNNAKYLELSKKVNVYKHTEFGDGPFSIRGCLIDITMKDGSVIHGETDAPRWSEAPTEEQLKEKFFTVTDSILSGNTQKKLVDLVGNVDQSDNKGEILGIMKNLK